MSNEKFQNIENRLDNIKYLKTFRDSKEIGNYLLNILLEMNLWEKPLIYTKLKEAFL